MQKKLWLILVLLLVVPGLLFTASCAKKTVKSEAAVTKAEEDEAVIRAKAAAEKAKQEEEERERQRALEEERLKQERLREERLKQERLREEAAKRERMAARERFLNENIHFEFDRSFLTSEAQEILKRKAKWLRENSGASVIIKGHCDERGTNEYNMALGDRRAESAKSFLIDLGIDESRLTTISYGEERPLDPRHNEEAWAKNRRDEFVVE